MKTNENALEALDTVSSVEGVWGRASQCFERHNVWRHASQQLSILCMLSHMSELEIHLYTEHGASWLQKHLQYYKEGSKQVS